MPIEPGKLRAVVELLGEARTDDGRGGRTKTGTGYATISADVRAMIRPLRGGERRRAMQGSQDVSHEVRIRYDEIGDATLADNVKAMRHEGRLLEVVVAPINEGEIDDVWYFQVLERV